MEKGPSRTPPTLLQYLCMRKSNMFSLFRYVSPPSSYFRNLLIFRREERRVYIMQKLDCRIPNWRTFLELMSYFPRLSRDLRKKIFQTAQHAGINLWTHFFSKNLKRMDTSILGRILKEMFVKCPVGIPSQFQTVLCPFKDNLLSRAVRECICMRRGIGRF